MRKIHERVFVGSLEDCFHDKSGWATIHACKFPCHQQAVCYMGNLSSKHPNYLFLEDDTNLYLNVIDPPIPLFMPLTFIKAREFFALHWKNGENILIHCNLGESRAPTLALIFLAKDLKVIPDTSFESARVEYEKIDPSYSPGRGIQTFLSKNWSII